MSNFRLAILAAAIVSVLFAFLMVTSLIFKKDSHNRFNSIMERDKSSLNLASTLPVKVPFFMKK